MLRILIILLFVCSVANAETYIQHKGSEIIGLSSQKDMVLEEGASITALEENIPELGLTRDISFYEFKGGKIKLNTKKIVERENQQIADEQKAQENANKKASAFVKLKELGLTEEEVEALIGGQ